MMAGLLIISVISGAVAAIAALAMSLPFWMAFVAYALCGMVTLVLGAALVSFRGTGGTHGFAPAHLSTAQGRSHR